jgi:hypothetical protein
VTSSAARKGHQAELEAAAALAELTGWPVQRRLQEGRSEDCGDLDGIPDTCVQVKWRTDMHRAIREGLAAVRHQRAAAGARYGVALVRRQGRLGTAEPRFVALMELDQLAALLLAANSSGPAPQQQARTSQPEETTDARVPSDAVGAHRISGGGAR